MEFILIPILLIFLSAGGIFFIVWRKISHLKELIKIENYNDIPVANNWHTLISDLCPEFFNWVKGIKVKEYKEAWLIETEKLLRRLRVASLKIDRFSDSLIKKIRRQTYSGNDVNFSVLEINRNKQDSETKLDDRTELKKREHGLIIEIAKNPKNATLYEDLGDLYLKMGDYQDAKESYEAAIELNSSNEELKKKLSQALENLNKLESSRS